MAPAVRETIDAVWKIESATLIARLHRLVRDVGLAEELAHDALVVALEQWPVTGIPRNPAAWLMTIAQRRAVDFIRRARLDQRKTEELFRDADPHEETDIAEVDARLDDNVGDDLLRLIFMTCHPDLSPEARVALTLKLLGGLTTAEIGRAYLVAEATVAQRIVRAKRTLSELEAPLEVPRGAELEQRLGSVLEVLYLIFNEGYTATAGSEWTRPVLCEEALRLGRILTQIAPQVGEVHGLLALMELQASRLKARQDARGEPILLLDQDRARWDQLLIHRGLTGLQRAQTLQTTPGPYTLQAAIAACHARARTGDETDWATIAKLYDWLVQQVPSPVVELNRAVAVAMAFGPSAGLEIVDALLSAPALQGYHLLPSVRGDLLEKLGRFAEARQEFERAAQLTDNERERTLLAERARAVSSR